MKCVKCSFENIEGASSCSNCGNVLTSVNTVVNQPTEVITSSQPVVNNPAPVSSKPNKKKSPIILIIAAIIILIIVGILVIPKLFTGSTKTSSGNKEEIGAFFIDNEEGNYAIFNLDGKQLTDFIFKTAYGSDLKHHAALVEDKDGKRGIVNDKGKMTVDFNKYSSVRNIGALYIGSLKGEVIIITPAGKEILKDTYINAYDILTDYTAIETDKEFSIYNYKGNKILTIKKTSKDSSENLVTSNDSNNDIALIHYDNKNYILDTANDKLIGTFEDSNSYCIDDVKENNRKELLIESCKEFWHQEINNVQKYIKNGKVLFTKNSTEEAEMRFYGDNIYYNADGKTSLLDSAGKVLVDFKSAEFYDDKNYIADEGDMYDHKYVLYYEGKSKGEISCTSFDKTLTGYNEVGMYLFGNCQKEGYNSYYFYKKDGTRLNSEPYKEAENFDKLGRAVVSKDRKNYYLINTKNEKVSEDYSKLYLSGFVGHPYYLATTLDNQEAILSPDVKEIVKAEDIELSLIEEHVYAIITRGKNYEVYDIDNGKSITTLEEEPNFDIGYFKTISNGKTQYYSYTTGKLFYEKKNSF